MRSRANECLLNAAMLAGVVGLGLRHRARRHSANSLATLARCSFADWLDSVTVVELHQALSSAEDKVSSTFHHITLHYDHITITSHHITITSHYDHITLRSHHITITSHYDHITLHCNFYVVFQPQGE